MVVEVLFVENFSIYEILKLLLRETIDNAPKIWSSLTQGLNL